MVSPTVMSSCNENTFGFMMRPAVCSGCWSRVLNFGGVFLPHSPEDLLLKLRRQMPHELRSVVRIQLLEKLRDLLRRHVEQQLGTPVDAQLGKGFAG